MHSSTYQQSQGRWAGIAGMYLMVSVSILVLLRPFLSIHWSMAVQIAVLVSILGTLLHFLRDLIEYKGIRVKGFKRNMVYLLVPGKLSPLFHWMNPTSILSLFSFLDDHFQGYTFPYTSSIHINQLCLLMTMKGVPYEMIPINMMPFGEQLPVIELNGRVIRRMDRIVKTLFAEFRLKENGVLGNKDIFIARNIQTILACHLMPIALHFQLKKPVDPTPHSLRDVAKIAEYAGNLVTRFQIRSAFQFIGMVSREERDSFLLSEAEADIFMLSELLGSRKYLFGMNPCHHDACALAYLDFAFASSPELRNILLKYENLIGYMCNLREEFGHHSNEA